MVQTDSGSVPLLADRSPHASRGHTRNPHLYPVRGRGRHRCRENRFTSGSQDGDQTESTVAGRTVPEATAREATVPEATVPETTVSEDVEKPVEEAEETTVVVRKEPKGPGKGDPGAGSYGGIREDDSFEKAGLPVSPASRSTCGVARNTANRESRASRLGRASPPKTDPTMPERRGLEAILARSPFVTRTG